MRIGIVCPYSLEVPGGVQAHVTDLARVLRRLGHHVDVLALADDDTPLREGVTSAGRPVRIPYNGSVVRLAFGPVSFTRVRRWIRQGDFDVLHLHEPTAPSLSLLALAVAEGPIVATFHAATERSRTLRALQRLLEPRLEKITARIAVSAPARRTQVEHLGGDAVEIPNGVDTGYFADAQPLPGYPHPGGAVGFVGRFDEPRKGTPVLLDALRRLESEYPDLRLLLVGRGDTAALRDAAGPALAPRLDCLGQVDDTTKARALASVDVFCAPHIGGESFGIVLIEAMAAGVAVVASDLDAFRRVLDDGRVGVLAPAGDAAALARAVGELLADPARRAGLAAAGRKRVEAYDWSVVARAVLRVYEAAISADPRRVSATREGPAA